MGKNIQTIQHTPLLFDFKTILFEKPPAQAARHGTWRHSYGHKRKKAISLFFRAGYGFSLITQEARTGLNLQADTEKTGDRVSSPSLFFLRLPYKFVMSCFQFLWPFSHQQKGSRGSFRYTEAVYHLVGMFFPTTFYASEDTVVMAAGIGYRT